MCAASQNRPAILRSALAALVGTLSLAASALAADPWKSLDVRPQAIVGTLSCSAVSCHGGGGPRYWGGVAAGGEYVSWIGQGGTFREGRRHYDPLARLEKHDGDPHALAGQRLASARFQEVLQRTCQTNDAATTAATYQRCARCHDSAAIDNVEVLGAQHSEAESRSGEIQPIAASSNTVNLALSPREKGIGCETCHGGAKQWLAVHYQRDISRERLLNLGLVDTKNLLVRARLCASCHVGSAENDMNHDMIAAGHPPLRFELASYEALIGRKHWDDRATRAANSDYEVQLWAAGRVAAAEAALALLEGRAAKRSRELGVGSRKRDAVVWPEFAEGNCFACHQPLRSTAERTVGPVALLGNAAATWQTWNLALVNDLAHGRPALDSELPPADFASASRKLRSAMEASFAPRADEIAKLAHAARMSLSAALRLDDAGRVLDVAGKPLCAEQVLNLLAVRQADVNWDEMCQEVASLAAVMRAIEDRAGQPVAPGIQTLRERLKRVARGLQFGQADREWPAVFDSGATAITPRLAVSNANEARLELDSIRGALIRFQSITISE